MMQKPTAFCGGDFCAHDRLPRDQFVTRTCINHKTQSAAANKTPVVKPIQLDFQNKCNIAHALGINCLFDHCHASRDGACHACTSSFLCLVVLLNFAFQIVRFLQTTKYGSVRN